jgi:hypothetical protein
MLYTLVLVSHLLAAVVSIGLGAFALYAVARSQSAWYQPLALSIGFVAGFEVVSGTTLALLSADLAAAALSLHIAIYLGACLMVELLLFYKMATPRLRLAEISLSPMFVSLGIFVAAVSQGV